MTKTIYEKNEESFVPRSAGESLLALCDVMTKLRAPHGCEWDKAQDLDSLRPYLIEEAYEVLTVLDQLSTTPASQMDDSGYIQDHCQELGDLLLQIVFQSEIQREAQHFHIGQVADAVREKLERRHPHLFGTDAEKAAGRVPWEKIKEAERVERTGQRKGALDGVPDHLPALLKALRTGEKAHGVGFDWPDHQGVVLKIEEELEEVKEAIQSEQQANLSAEIGDLLYAIVNLCRHFKIDPEASLRGTINRFNKRFQKVEAVLDARGLEASQCDLDELEELWQQAKQELHQSEQSPTDS